MKQVRQRRRYDICLKCSKFTNNEKFFHCFIDGIVYFKNDIDNSILRYERNKYPKDCHLKLEQKVLNKNNYVK